tara:strand:+ start:1609 stop:2310 length:702 start_codon:yes stop_codon:yes gene_type:complete
MAKYWTLAEIREKVQQDLDLEGEVFIQPTELTNYINQAIDEAEAEIHSIYEDYFLTDYFVPLVTDENLYSLPPDIYAHKIRKIIFSDDQSKTYEVARIPESAKFQDIALTERFRSTEFYRYLLYNKEIGNPQMYFVPAIREGDTSPSRMRVWYLRNANRLVAETDVCDIPEFVHFVIGYTKLRCLEKEMHPGTTYWADQVERQRRLMVDTLANMIPDGETRVEPDMTTYEEIS